MLLPVFSVTFIGLVVGLIFFVTKRHKPLLTFLIGIAGAWMGFLLGAVFGLVFDVIIQTGLFLGILGHLFALAGSALALSRFRIN